MMNQRRRRISTQSHWLAALVALGMTGCAKTESATKEARPGAPDDSAPALPEARDSHGALLAIWEEALSAGEDRAGVEAALSRVDAELAHNASPDAHHVRGRILGLLGRSADALAAHEEALRLDPTHAEARYSAGLLLATSGREDDGFAHWATAAKQTPAHGDSAYNAGQYLYDRGRFEEALEMWRLAREAMPGDFDAAKKVVQALNALGRAEEAEAAKQEVRRLFEASNDPAVKRQVQVVIDQLVVGGRKVMVHEALAPTKPELHYHWTALVYDAEGKRPAFSVQLESSAYGRETGVPFVDGVTRPDSTHSTFGKGYASLPSYADWRRTAVKRIEKELGI
jgi:tetratricopeptide (TPR) repeat protein